MEKILRLKKKSIFSLDLPPQVGFQCVISEQCPMSSTCWVIAGQLQNTHSDVLTFYSMHFHSIQEERAKRSLLAVSTLYLMQSRNYHSKLSDF